MYLIVPPLFRVNIIVPQIFTCAKNGICVVLFKVANMVAIGGCKITNQTHEVTTIQPMVSESLVPDH
ncbi:UNVERIFIED_CONTAM: hypothetical protein NCL1_27821 [Trichonephila clavipes]